MLCCFWVESCWRLLRYALFSRTYVMYFTNYPMPNCPTDNKRQSNKQSSRYYVDYICSHLRIDFLAHGQVSDLYSRPNGLTPGANKQIATALLLSVSYAKGCLQCDKDSLTLSALACLSFKNSIKYDWIANFTCLLWLCSFCQYK